jgi:hypothetical protein
MFFLNQTKESNQRSEIKSMVKNERAPRTFKGYHKWSLEQDFEACRLSFLKLKRSEIEEIAERMNIRFDSLYARISDYRALASGVSKRIPKQQVKVFSQYQSLFSFQVVA